MNLITARPKQLLPEVRPKQEVTTVASCVVLCLSRAFSGIQPYVRGVLQTFAGGKLIVTLFNLIIFSTHWYQNLPSGTSVYMYYTVVTSSICRQKMQPRSQGPLSILEGGRERTLGTRLEKMFLVKRHCKACLNERDRTNWVKDTYNRPFPSSCERGFYYKN